MITSPGRSTLILLGRVLMAAIFLGAAANKIINFEQTRAGIAGQEVFGQKLPAPLLLTIGAIAFEGLGGLLIVLGLFTRLGACMLLVFLLVVTPIYHPFWADPAEQNSFMHNLALFGGLLVLLAAGPGCYSIDARRRREPPPPPARPAV